MFISEIKVTCTSVKILLSGIIFVKDVEENISEESVAFIGS